MGIKQGLISRNHGLVIKIAGIGKFCIDSKNELVENILG